MISSRLLNLNLLLIIGMLSFLPFNLGAQSLGDISSIKVDDLSDQQIQVLMERATEAGLSEAELLQMAQLRGVPASEIDKLKERLQGMVIGLQGGQKSGTAPNKRSPRRQIGFNEITQGIIPQESELDATPPETEPIFGLDIFYNKERRLTFEPNLNMATPRNYILGPGDELYVDVYGQSEQFYKASVTPEGQVILENIGPINVSGLSLDEATAVIKNRLSVFYTGLRGSNPNTFLQVNLGNVRTIKVNMVGEVRLPGTFTLSAFSTVFNALYAAGGPNRNGTLREIKLIRQNKEIAEIDIYDFLINGDPSLNVPLQDQDVILVQPYLERVKVEGAVKRPKIFEIKPDETFANILTYAGGFTDNAYRERVNVTRLTDKEKAVSDIFNEQFSLFLAKGGDRYKVGEVLDRYTNRVQVKGSVYRPGSYAYEEGLTLTGLIKKAEGLSGEAYRKRINIVRTNEDLTTNMLQVDLNAIETGISPDIPLRKEDVVHVPSIYQLSEEFYVKVSGEVLYPGTYPYSREMTSEDLILMAGGLKEAASVGNIEIARRTADQDGKEFARIIPVPVRQDLALSENPIGLMPFDHLTVRRKTNFSLERMASIEGQVNAPGTFAIKDAEERISDLIERAGGLTAFAYPKGATLIRRTEFYQTASENIRKERNLLNLLERLNRGNEEPTESQKQMIDRINAYLFGEKDSTQNEMEESVINARRTLLNEISASREEIDPIKIKETEAIAIDLEEIIRNPDSKFDLILEEGDILSVPRQLQTVRLRGDVIYPTTVRHEDFRGLPYYIDRAGGFDSRAKRKRTYVVYANGEVARTKNYLFFNIYPSVEPGSEIIVPTKGPRIPVRPGDLVGLTTGLATIALVITQILNSN
ncbi:SLBB domain-containing protein [Cyclobacterium plantarum]|uniref:Capsule biosynthesis protein n=1 Tax=Cyclobacterium plantarum TaxID=2716263 RepID=A0ABX0H983_9BACT|nr:SLBB domain-containing protein [Cyclobacterium plantarum]NHE58454.1 capsule biosynthesis protein [Cyclobacterium plantarum]